MSLEDDRILVDAGVTSFKYRALNAENIAFSATVSITRDTDGTLSADPAGADSILVLTADFAPETTLEGGTGDDVIQAASGTPLEFGSGHSGDGIDILLSTSRESGSLVLDEVFDNPGVIGLESIDLSRWQFGGGSTEISSAGVGGSTGISPA